MTLRIGVIGCGYWGPNLVRNFFKVEGVVVAAVADCDPRRLRSVSRLYPGVRTYASGEDLICGGGVDAVAIATPLSTHYSLAKIALEQGKHVLIEKPMTATADQGEELIRLSLRAGKILMVDQTFVYSGAVRQIRELVAGGELGEIRYYDSVRVNLGLFQPDVNVVWDLAPHDLSVMLYLFDKEPIQVSAIGAKPVTWKGWDLDSIAYVTIRLAGGVLAHLHVNWLSPVKVRRTLIGGDRKMVVYDHLDPDNQVKVFDRGISLASQDQAYGALVQYRTGDMFAPKVDQTEALARVCEHFVDCIRNEKAPLTDGNFGVRVVRLLESAQKSIEHDGKSVFFGPAVARAGLR